MSVTSADGALLIFDEVMTGFRVHPGGAQTLFDIKPDITALGKVIGGGLPVGAYGGRRDIMEMVAPVGPMYQAGTLSGNPLAMTAGIETLKMLKEPGVWEGMEAQGAKLMAGLGAAAQGAGIRRFGQPSGHHVRPLLQSGAGDRLGFGRRFGHGAVRQTISGACWRRASTWRRLSLKPAFCRPPTVMPRSTRRLPRLSG